MSAEEERHSNVNLLRVLRRLEKAVSPVEWAICLKEAEADEVRAGLKVLKELQKARYAKKLMKSVRFKEDGRYEDLNARLDHVLQFLEQQSEKLAYKPKRPEPILPALPIPKHVINIIPDSESKVEVEEGTAIPDVTADLLRSPSDDVLAPCTILPLPLPLPEDSLLTGLPTKSTVPSTANSLATNALHGELQAQLSQMSTQLRMNALHFQTSLAADKLALDAVGEKLESNSSTMQIQRTRLGKRDKSARGWRMTGLWLGSVLVVVVAFLVMVWMIRFT